MKVAFLTRSDTPKEASHISADLFKDDLLAVDELQRRGISVDFIVWDDPNNNAKEYDVLVVRSTYDYIFKIEKFYNFLDDMRMNSVPILNRVNTLLWNTNKHYLRDLEVKGVRIVPTVYLPKAVSKKRNSPTIVEIMRKHCWSEVVVKLCVGMASVYSWRVQNEEEAVATQPELDELLQTRQMMVTQFLPKVLESGEWSLVYFDKQFSHAVNKHPPKGDYRAQPWCTPERKNPPGKMMETADKIIHTLKDDLLYARVDLVESEKENEEPYLMELELIEPVLFFKQAPERIDVFADAVMKFYRKMKFTNKLK